MPRRYGLLILLTVVIVMACAYSGFMAFRPAGLPFDVNVVNAHTTVVEPLANIPLPSTLRAGDRLDLAALSRPARIAVSIMHLSNYSFPLGQAYEFVIYRDAIPVTVSVTTVDLGAVRDAWWFEWTTLSFSVLLGVIALLALWRGRDRAAAGMALWTIAFLVGLAFQHAQLNGLLGLSAWLGANVLYVAARCGFYIMIESMLGPVLTPRTRWLWRGGFLLLLAAGAVTRLGGPILLTATGWAELLRPQYGLVFSMSYLVPLALLIVNYGYADSARRLRLRWMLWSSVIFVVNIFLNNTAVLGPQVSSIVTNAALVLSLSGFLYALLRHRVVDVSVVIDRTIVYGGMTAVVVGVLAAVNSLVEHAALGTNASLLLQVIVPLSLGIVLSRVRTYLDRMVEQVFFRRKYLAEKKLRRFARHCTRYERTGRLFEEATTEIRRHLGARGIAIYERKGEGYARVRQEGEVAYPEQMEIDDVAFVAVRADQKDIDLSELTSALGTDGYVFPMTAFGELQGVLVCANRPGEHYAADERKLLTYVAHQMGVALYALRMQAKAKLVDALASGLIPVPDDIQAKARELTSLAMKG
ncbi:MAG: GAF domain-containing protein [Gammaproteobacteria bacterium]